MPHLRTLVKRHEDDPFALVGINCYDSEEDFEAGVEKHGVTWISAFQSEDAPIAKQYLVQGFPTYVLIDHEGKIVWRGHHGYDVELERLIEEAKAAR